VITIQEFHQDFLQSILSDADSRGLMKPQAFFENVCEVLTSTGDLTSNYTAAEYTKKGLEVYGYDYDEERKILTLLAHHFFQDEELQTLSKSQIDIKFKKLKAFYTKCTEGFYQSMEEAFESYSMAYNIFEYQNNNKINKVKLIILSDGKATRNLLEIPNESIDEVEVEYRVIDIEYLYKIYMSENSGGDFEIDVNIPCLVIDSMSDEYESYMTYLNGNKLVEIYEKYGQKLFEQNVRTFLQFRGNVNKGLKNTIEFSPKMFFAYNNGLTATASKVEVDKNSNITKIINFQIVNGGQTTSAIYAAKRNSKLDVSDIFVQMKLSVVRDTEKQNDFVSKVSEYANTQNKINKSDFFSNSPFHKDFKNYSKRIWVAATGGSQKRTHWFYERVRGEYLNEQAYLKPSEKRQFQIENPKEQLLDKTFLSKSENVWRQKPDIVSKGAQYSFSEFADTITDQLEKDSLAITENYYRDSISRVILFRTVERIISKADWYNGGYRAQAVAYTISYLSYIIKKQKKYLNFNLIWDSQCVPDALITILEDIAEIIYNEINNPPEGNANVGQWCKKSACWESVKELDYEIEIDEELLLDAEEQKYNRKVDIKDKILLSGIEMQSFVVSNPVQKWKKLHEYFKKLDKDDNQLLSSTDWGVLEGMCNGRIKLATELQSKVLYKLYCKAVNEGFIW